MELLLARGEFSEAERLRREGYTHPLVSMAETTLSRLLSPRGSISCSELEVELREAMRRDPAALRAVLSGVVERYLAAVRRERRLAWAGGYT